MPIKSEDNVQQDRSWKERMEQLIWSIHEMLLEVLEEDAVEGLMELSDEGQQESPEYTPATEPVCGPLSSRLRGGSSIWEGTRGRFVDPWSDKKEKKKK